MKIGKISWENFWRESSCDWQYSFGKLADGRYFWTWFDYYYYDKIMLHTRPNTNKLLKIGENAEENDEFKNYQGCLGGNIYDTKEDLINGLLNDTMYLEGLEDKEEPDFVRFVKHIEHFLTK
jgi:hypothetical protein